MQMRVLSLSTVFFRRLIAFNKCKLNCLGNFDLSQSFRYVAHSFLMTPSFSRHAGRFIDLSAKMMILKKFGRKCLVVIRNLE